MDNKNPQYMADEAPDEAPDEPVEHRPGEACDCPACERAADISRAEALSDTEGRKAWQAEQIRQTHQIRSPLSNCCRAPETELYLAEYGICPKCKEHCVFRWEENE